MTIQDYALFGILGVLIVERALTTLKARGVDLQKMSNQLDDLHKWHSVTHKNGFTKVWYLPADLSDSIERIEIKVRAANKELVEQKERFKEQDKKLNTLNNNFEVFARTVTKSLRPSRD